MSSLTNATLWHAFTAGIATALIILAAFYAERLWRRFNGIKSPVEDKLLRPPGFSLMERLEILQDKVLDRGFLTVAFCALAGGLIPPAANAWSALPLKYGLFFCSLPVICGLTGLALALWTFKTFISSTNVKLGLRGEQATAEALHIACDAGFRVFHDLQAGPNWNIDHVVVGTKGVFMIETKARRRRHPISGRREDEVVFDGESLIFPFGRNTKAAPQAEKNRNWLSDYLSKMTAEAVPVEAVIALPGWTVTGQGFLIKAMNCDSLVKYLRNQKIDKISPDQVKRIVAKLEEMNRTVDF